MLVYIENKNNLAEILTYLDIADIKYTTDISKYKTVLITDINNKILKIIKNKKVFLLTNYIENKEIDKLLNIDNIKIITSLPLLKNNKNVIFIPKILPNVNLKKNKNIYEDYKITKNKKKIIVLDRYLKHVKEVQNILNEYPKFEFIYVGYKNSKREVELIENLNVVWIKYVNLNKYNDLCNISDMVIIFDKDIDINYLYLSILTHTEIFMVEDNNYNNYFIPSKHYYGFNNINNLNNKIKKLLTSRTSSLNDNAYFLIENNTEKNYIETLKKILK